MRIYDHEFQVSDTQMREMLEKAALEEHGFKLEITTKMMTETGTGSDEPVYQKTHYYYKIVDCSKVPEVSEQVESLIPGKIKTIYFERLPKKEMSFVSLRVNYGFLVLLKGLP